MLNLMDDIKKRNNLIVKRLPLIARNINELLSDPNLSVERLSNVIKLDSALVVNLMKVANLSFGYASKYNEISTISEAVARLGIQKVTHLAISTAVLKNFQVAEKSIERDLWLESIVTAVSSEVIAHACNLGNGEELFFLGLLRNIGILVILDILDMDSDIYEHYYRILKTKYRNGGDISRLERERFGTDHLEIGQYILREWKFPDFMVHCINPRLTGNGVLNKKIIGITRINLFAEKIADYLIFKNFFSYSQIFTFAKQYFNFSYNRTVDLLSEIDSQVDRYSKMLGLKLGLLNQADILDISAKKIKKSINENLNTVSNVQASLKDTVYDINGVLTLLQSTIDRSAVELERGNAKKAQNYIKHANNCIHHTKQYLNDIYTHYETGDANETNISQVVKKFVNLFNDVTSDNISVDCRMKDNFSFVNLKAGAIFKILFNLCKNALDAIHEKGDGKNAGNIKIRLENIEIKDRTINGAKKPYIQLTVADNGVGISSEVGNRIFEDNFSTKEGHKGRGLATINRLITGNGGIINYKSKWSSTVFYVVLPRCINHIQERRMSA